MTRRCTQIQTDTKVTSLYGWGSTRARSLVFANEWNGNDADGKKRFIAAKKECNIYKGVKVVHRSRSDNHGNCSDTRQPVVLLQLHQQPPCSFPRLEHTLTRTHTYTPPHTHAHTHVTHSLCAAFLNSFLEPVKQNNSRRVQSLTDCQSFPRLMLNRYGN